MKKTVLSKNIKNNIVSLFAGTFFCATFSMTSMAGQWMANNVGYWYVHSDGTYPTYSWEWIDNDGDGIYQCYAFDENGYLYTNTVTPDGYLVGPDGSWYENYMPVYKPFMNNASVVPTAIVPINQNGTADNDSSNTDSDDFVYSKDGTQLVANRYSSPKKKKNTSTSSKSTSKTTSKSSSSSSSKSSSSSSSKSSSGTVPSSQIVSSKIVTGGSSSSSSTSESSKSKDYTEPDVDSTSYDDEGPGANIPSSSSSKNYSPVTDTSNDNLSGPKQNSVIERDGYEDDSDDDEE
ncbi:hypothetical protein [Oribacterium sp. WCC10]|uniref:hypothetical protein n=1 Tax=Oribacterium sp. WCC10 TaxID=1855343 RepID=UPI000B89C8B4|nr:hypothetical protein [Oribacterium sp. WCC10]